MIATGSQLSDCAFGITRLGEGRRNHTGAGILTRRTTAPVVV